VKKSILVLIKSISHIQKCLVWSTEQISSLPFKEFQIQATNTYRNLVKKSLRKEKFGIITKILEDNIKMDLKYIHVESVN
jgi:hypothetical protein